MMRTLALTMIARRAMRTFASTAMASGSAAPHTLLVNRTALHRFYASRTYAQPALVDLLDSELKAEKDIYTQTHGEQPLAIDGWTFANDRAEVKLTKQYNNEKVTVSFNVTHTVGHGTGSGDEAMDDPNTPQEQGGPLTPATPPFTVEIEKNGRRLAFECEMNDDVNEESESPFDIMEVYMYTGDKADDDTYAVGGGVIDGGVYDHLLAYLGERGINDAFVGELQRVATQHEHRQYMQLLEDMKKFMQKK